MTKIKNTKKGMAKKTLSMSLVVAMLATSNVPVWAAEFSDGTDADVAITSEAPVAEDTDAADAAAFSDEATPEVTENTDDIADTATAATEKALYFEKAEIGKSVSFADDSVLKNAEGKNVTVFDYEWLIDGMQPAKDDGNAMDAKDYSGQVRLGGKNPSVAEIKNAITKFTPLQNHLGRKLTLKITGVKGTAEDFEGFTYETPAVTITAKDVKSIVTGIRQTGTLTYDGTAKTLTANDVKLTYNSGYSSSDIAASDFTFTYDGDTVNATKSGEPVKVTATVNKPGYQGSLTFDMTINQRTPALSSDKDLTDKTKNDLAVNLKKTQYKYTGSAINLLTNVEDNFTLKSNISGNTLKAKAITDVNLVEGTLMNAGDSAKVKVSITKTYDDELNRNYAAGAFDSSKGIGYTTAEKATVVARDLSTCTIDDISIGLLKSKNITKAEIKKLLSISEGKETLNTNTTFMNNVDIEVDTDAIHKGGEGTYTVVVKPTDTTKNVINRKTINLYVAQNNIADATLVTKDGQLLAGTELNSSTKLQDEYYQGGSAVEKTADQLGTIVIKGSTEVVLKAGTDYKVIYENNTNVGTAKVYLQGISSTLSGKKCIGTFAIKPAEISSTTITVPESVAYDGSKTEASEYLKKSDIKVQAKTYTWTKKTNGTFEKVGKLIDVPDTLYKTTFAADNNTLSGGKIVDGTKLTTTVKEADKIDTTSDAYKNYGISVLRSGVKASKNTTVATLSIANADVTVVGAPFVYTGKEIKPDLVVKDGNRTLVKDVDYEVVSTVNATNAGTAKITIKGKGDYSAAKTKTVEFTINKADLSKVTITPKKASVANNFTYTGKKLTPALTEYDVKLGDETLTTDLADIKITYPASSSTNVNAGKEAGSATLTVKDTAKNPNFEGTNAFKFDIEQAELNVGGIFTLWKDGKVVGLDKTTTSKNSVSSLTPIFTNDGTEHTFDKVTYKPADSKYKEGTDYEVKYYNNVRGEVAAIYVNALGNYKNKADNKFADKKTTYTDARFFKIGAIAIKKSDVKVANTEYAGGIAVKPTVTVTVNGKTLVDDSDYKIETVGDASSVTAKDKILKAKLYAKDGYVLDTTSWGASNIIKDANGSYVELTWKVVAKDLKNTTVAVDKDGNVTVMNGSVVVPSKEYDVKFSEDGKKVTVTAKADSKNYTGSKEVDVDAVKVGASVINTVKVSGNKATVILSDEAEGASGYDYVVSTSKDPSDKEARIDVVKNQVQTTASFKYLQQGTYYAYCHAWTRDENGKKVFGEWSNSYAFSVTAITPDTPEIISVKTKGSTITVTYKESANSKGYDVVLGKGSKKEHGETRPSQYGNYKKLNVKPGVCKAVFKNVPAGTYYAGVHSWNRTASENDNKVFSKWSNLETAKVK